MVKMISKITFIAVIIFIWLAPIASAEVVIKVRALNPLDTKEIAVIRYPLPKEVSKENILKQKITYSMDHSEDEEPPKTSFKISYDEEKGEYYIDDEVLLFPKEVVTLEVHVEDVWVIEKSDIEKLRGQVDGLLEAWEKEISEEKLSADAGSDTDVDVKTNTDITEDKSETKEFALMMKEEILIGLNKIIERQDANEIIDVGVERHITAYKSSIDELRQVEQDIVLLANLIQFEGQESEEAELEGDETPNLEVQDGTELQVMDDNEVVE